MKRFLNICAVCLFTLGVMSSALYALSTSQILSGSLDDTNGRMRLKVEAYSNTATTKTYADEAIANQLWDSTNRALTVSLSGATANGQLLIGNASTGAFTIATLTAGSGMSISNGAGTVTLTSSALYPSDAGDGKIYIGRNTGAFAAANITGTSNQVVVTNGTNSITLSTPQSIATTSTPQFARVGLGAAADATHILTATSASTTNNSEVLDVTHTGIITGTGYGAKIAVTGASTTNIGLDVTASGAGTNTAINATGDVSITGALTATGIVDGLSLTLGNDETITNATNGTITLTADTLQTVMGTTGGWNLVRYEATSGALSGASGSIAVNIPSGAKIKGCQLRVDTLITSGDGATSWAAAYATGATQSIATGQAFTKSTKVNAFFDANGATDIASGTTTITITPNAGTFSAGVVRAICYAETFTAMADAP
jgi:hypothetical protein